MTSEAPNLPITQPLNLFSKQASSYAKYRPSYPAELFDQLSELCPERHLAVDFATGNGQAARDLADRFTHVVGVDISSEQITHAAKKPNISYLVSPVENFIEVESRPADGTVDLITVAEAVHWFDLDKFYSLARRLLKPTGLLAVWGYNMPFFNHKPLDDLVNSYCYETLGGYLHPRAFNLLKEEYKTLPFPFKELPVKNRFLSERNFSQHNLLGNSHLEKS